MNLGAEVPDLDPPFEVKEESRTGQFAEIEPLTVLSPSSQRAFDVIGQLIDELTSVLLDIDVRSPVPPVGGGNDPALIGTWRLSTVNGRPLPAGVFITWTFTATTVTVTDDLDGDVLTAVEI